MKYNYAPRLSLSYNDLSGVVRAIANVCEALIVYEHKADSKVKKTHIHMVIAGSSVKDEALRRLAQKTLSDVRMSGNEFWKWSIHKDHKDLFEEDPMNFITYMSKGELAPVFVKEVSMSVIEEYRSKWVSRSVPAPQAKYDEYEAMKTDLMAQSHYWSMSLDSVRTWSMAWYWKRDGRMPHAGQYKRNAASLYVFCRSYGEGRIDSALEELKNLWY